MNVTLYIDHNQESHVQCYTHIKNQHMLIIITEKIPNIIIYQ